MTDSGIFYVHRGRGTPVLLHYAFATRLFSLEARLADLPAGPSLAASADGSWFLAVRLEDRKSDILLLDRFE